MPLIPDGAEAQTRILRWTGEAVTAGDTRFGLDGFAELIAYVDRGGYPGWRDERRPEYVAAMVESLREISSPLLG